MQKLSMASHKERGLIGDCDLCAKKTPKKMMGPVGLEPTTDRLNDSVIIEFPPNSENLSYKLVLSGWKSGEIKFAFGTL